jgi:hypothetical protein
MSTASPPADYDQNQFRFYKDDAGINAATARAAQNTNISMVADTNVRLRFNISSTVNPPAQNKPFQLYYQKNASGPWLPVNTTTPDARTFISSNVTDGAATTEQLAGSGSFNAGTFDEGDGTATGFTATPATGQDTEVEFCFQLLSADYLPTSETMDFRVYSGDFPIDTYSVTPRITIVPNPNGEVRIPLTNLSSGVALLTGTATGNLKIRARKRINGSLTPASHPTLVAEIRDGTENGATVLKSGVTLGINGTSISNVTSDGQMIDVTFDQSGISTPDNAAIWLITSNIIGASIQPLSVEWNAQVEESTGPATIPQSITLTSTSLKDIFKLLPKSFVVTSSPPAPSVSKSHPRSLTLDSSSLKEIFKGMAKVIAPSVSSSALSSTKQMSELIAPLSTSTKDLLKNIPKALVPSDSASEATQIKSVDKPLPSTSDSDIVLASVLAFVRSVIPSASESSASLIKGITKGVDLEDVSVASMVRVLSALRTIETDVSSSTVSMLRGREYLRELAASASSDIDLLKLVGKNLSLESATSPLLSQVLSANRSLDLSSSSLASLFKELPKAYELSSSSVAALSRILSLNRLIDPAEATSLASLIKEIPRTYNLSSSSSVVFARILSLNRLIEPVEAVSLAFLIKEMSKVYELSSGSAAVLARVLSLDRLIDPVESTSLASVIKSVPKAFASASGSTVEFARTFSAIRELSVSSTHALVRQLQHPRFFDLMSSAENLWFFKSVGKLIETEGTSSTTLTLGQAVLREIITTSTQSASLSLGYFRTLSAASSHLADLVSEFIERQGDLFFSTIDALSPSTPELQKTPGLIRSVTSSSTPSLDRILSLFRAMDVSSSSSPDLARVANLIRLLEVSSFQTARRQLTVGINFLLTSTSQVDHDQDLLKSIIIEAVSSSAASLVKMVQFILSASNTSTPLVQWDVDMADQLYFVSVEAASSSSAVIDKLVGKIISASSISELLSNKSFNKLIETSSSHLLSMSVGGAIMVTVGVVSESLARITKGKELILAMDSSHFFVTGRSWGGAKKFLTLMKKIGV